MPTTVKFRRGTTAQNDAFTGAAGEISVDETLDTIRVHDGSTAGGFAMVSEDATQTLTNKTLTSAELTTPTVGGVSLAEYIADTIGSMVTSNTETNITVTYEDSDNTLDFVIGTLNQDTSGNAATATALETSRTISLTGDASGSASFDGTGDASITVTVADDSHNHVTSNIDGLAEYIADTVGAMVGSNTETGITVTYDDADNTLDFVIGTLNQDTTGNAATATALETARTIAGQSFDGTANISIAPTDLTGVTSTAGEINLLDGSAAGTVTNSKAVVYGASGEVNATTLQIGGTSISATAAELNYVDGVTSNVQTQLDAKQATVTGAATTVTSNDLTASRAVISNASGKVAVSDVTSTELGYLDGVTSNVQTQLDGKATTAQGALADSAVQNLSDLSITASAAELNKLDGATVTVTEINKLDGYTGTYADLNYAKDLNATGVTATEFDYLDGVTSNIQTQLDAKQATVTGGASSIASSNLTATRALVSDGSGKVAVSAVTSTELGYLDGVTSAIQTQLDAKVAKSGSTMTGALTLSGDPTAGNHAATKSYVDTIASAGLHYHDPVRGEVETNFAATYNNGSSGVGATLTATSNGAFALGGITDWSTSERVLIYNQSTAAQNGIYTVTTVGDGSTAAVLTRATDADSYAPSDSDSLGEGDAFYVQEGDGAGELYVMTTSGTITFGTTSINFSQISSAQIYSGGTDITLSGTTFNLDSTISADTTGNAATASALASAVTVSLSGDVSGSATFTNAGDTATITATVADDSHNHVTGNIDGLSEYIADTVGAMVTSNTESGITVTYQDTDNTLDFTVGTLNQDTTGSAATLTTARTISLAGDVSGSTTFDGSANVSITATVADDSHNHVTGNIDGLAEYISDTVGAMVTSNTESGISVTYDDADNTLDFNVNDPTISLTGDVSGSATMTNLGNVSITATVADDSHNHVTGNIDGLAEYIADTVGAMWSSNSESGVSVTYQDTDNTLDINVNDPVITISGDASGSATMTNLGNTTISVSLAANSVAANEIAASAVGASELNVSGNGTTSQFLRSDGDGTFTWAIPTDTNTTYSAGTGLSLSSTTFSLASAGAGAGTYGSTTDGTKIDSITLDAYGRVTAVATGATGDIQGVTAGTGLSGGGTSGTVTVNLSHLGIQSLSDPNDDRIMMWDDSAGATAWLDIGSGLSVSGTTISNSGVTSVNGSTGSISASQLLTAIKTVDGSGSGLDADLLDGVTSGSFLRSDASDSFSGNLTGSGTLDINNTITAYRGVGDTHTDTTNSGTVTPDFSRYTNFVWTLTGNVTLGNPGDEAVGQSGFFVFLQDGTGGRTLSLSSDYESAGGAGLTLSSTASAADVVPYIVIASNRILLGAPQLAFA